MTGDFEPVDWPVFKQLASEFFKALPRLKEFQQVEGGHKCLIMAYTHLEANELEMHQARIVLDIAARKAGARVREVLFAGLKT